MSSHSYAGAGAESSDPDLQAIIGAAVSRPLKTADVHVGNASRSRQRRFVDDQAAGGDSSESDHPDSPVSDRPAQSNVPANHGTGLPSAVAPMNLTASSSSSEDDRPLAAKRHRSRSLQRQSPASDTDSFSSLTGSPAKLTDNAAVHAQHSNPVTAQPRHFRKQTTRSLHQVLSMPGDNHNSKGKQALGQDRSASKHMHTHLDMPRDTSQLLQDKDQMQPSSSETATPEEEEEGAATDSVGVHGEEEPTAFEVPSQMPRELQSWAWDK